MTTWKDIPGYEGLYQVSDGGMVRSVDRTAKVMSRWGFAVTRSLKGRVLSTSAFPNGYMKVSLGRDNCQLVHRLVALAFIDGDTSMQVNHKNGIRSDNSVENLEWVTCSENHLHSYRELPRKQHVWTKPVSLIKGGVAVVFPSILAAAKSIGVHQASVSSAVNKKHLCRGYEVAYV